MAVPLVAEFSACTSTYGRLAPLPPVAVAADADGVTTAKAPAAASKPALTAKTIARLGDRMDCNTYCSFSAPQEIDGWPGGGAPWRPGLGGGHGELIPRTGPGPVAHER